MPERYLIVMTGTLTSTPPVLDRYSTGTPPVPEGQVTSTAHRAWEGQAQGTAFSVSRPQCSSVQLAHPAASIYDVQPPYWVRRVELFPPVSTGALMVPAGVLPVPTCTFTVPARSHAAPYGFYGSVPLSVSPTMVGRVTQMCRLYASR